jgi:serine/threonine protein kinase
MGGLPEVGQSFGEYEITGVIGEGGMGVVYTAVQRRLDRTVALKVLSTRLMNEANYRQRFTREAETLSRLDSPHIIQIYDFGEVDDCLFIATQMVRGGDLGQLLRSRGALGTSEAVVITGQVASALVDAHAAGVVHRDIKPNNVLLRRGPERFAYLCDFGIALSDAAALTTTGTMLGTTAYLAPERCDGMPATTASDIYSLGCLLWTAVTGQVPYHGTDVQVAVQHMTAPIPQLPRTDAFERRVNAIVLRSMAKKPGERYAAAGEMRADLLNLVPRSELPEPDLADTTAWPSPTAPAPALPADLPTVAATVASGSSATVESTHDVASTEATAPTTPLRRQHTEGHGWSHNRRKTMGVIAAGVILTIVGSAIAVSLGRDTGTPSGGGAPSNRIKSTASPGARAGATRGRSSKTPAVPSPSAGEPLDQAERARRQTRLTRVSFDGDQMSDLAVQSFTGSGDNVVVLSSNRNGFGRPRSWSTIDTSPTGSIHRFNGDFDGDDITDAAVADYGRGSWTVSVLRSSGDQFAPPKSWGHVSAAPGLNSFFVTGDYDGDGHADVATVDFDDLGLRIQVLKSTGGSFKTPHTWASNLHWGYSRTKFVPGDFNADGRTDLFAVRQLGHTLVGEALLSNGKSFEAPRRWTVIPHASWNDVKPMAGDFDGDGRTDVLVYLESPSGGAEALFLRSDGEGLQPPERWWQDATWDAERSWVSVGDFNADGKADVVRIAPSGPASIDAWVLLSTGTGLDEKGVWGRWASRPFEQVRTLNKIG